MARSLERIDSDLEHAEKAIVKIDKRVTDQYANILVVLKDISTIHSESSKSHRKAFDVITEKLNTLETKFMLDSELLRGNGGPGVAKRVNEIEKRAVIWETMNVSLDNLNDKVENFLKKEYVSVDDVPCGTLKAIVDPVKCNSEFRLKIKGGVSFVKGMMAIFTLILSIAGVSNFMLIKGNKHQTEQIRLQDEKIEALVLKLETTTLNKE